MSFDGGLDDVRLWSEARTAADIAAHLDTTYDAASAPSTLIDQFDFDTSFDSLRGNYAAETVGATRVAR